MKYTATTRRLLWAILLSRIEGMEDFVGSLKRNRLVNYKTLDINENEFDRKTPKSFVEMTQLDYY